MSEWKQFQVPRTRGVAFHVLILLFILSAVGIMVTVASENLAGLRSVLLLVASVLLALVFPILAYRLFALLQSEYAIGREGLLLRWGLRQVHLPFDTIIDYALGRELEAAPALPRWRWPGSVQGKIKDEELGEVEYLASDARKMVFIGTLDRVFAISPEAPEEFLAALRNEAERGSLEKMEMISQEPSFVLTQAWADRSVRVLLIAGAVLALALMILVGFVVQGRESISLGFTALGQADEPVAAAQLYLLPTLNIVIFMGNFLLGLVLFRDEVYGAMAKVIWASSLLIGALFFGAILFIAGAG